MTTISLNQYAPIISDDTIGEEIFTAISNALSADTVTVDFDGVKSMATFCAKQIFGRLYKSLGPESFYTKIWIKNANEEIKVIIRMGIVSALNQN